MSAYGEFRKTVPMLSVAHPDVQREAACATRLLQLPPYTLRTAKHLKSAFTPSTNEPGPADLAEIACLCSASPAI